MAITLRRIILLVFCICGHHTAAQRTTLPWYHPGSCCCGGESSGASADTVGLQRRLADLEARQAQVEARQAQVEARQAQLEGKQAENPVSCPEPQTPAACGWRLAYKIQSYAGDGFTLWGTTFNIPELPGELALSPAIGHYKSREINGNWASLGIKKVKVTLYTFSPTLQTRDIIFNAEGSTMYNWFSQNRLISSPWTDLKHATTNYFSIEGHREEPRRINRRFFINRSYGGCAADAGWLVVLDGNSICCPWEKRTGGTPRVLFSKRSTSVNFERDPGNVGVADVMAIFIKTCDD